MNTEIVKVDLERVSEYTDVLARASELIKRGGLVVFPTETVYGLGANGLDSEAARKIYEAKGRPSDNPLIIHIASPVDATKYTYTDELYFRLAERFMPGPLTVVMKARDSVPMATRAGLPTVAVRCPENKIARKLIELSGVPIAAPSANLSGSPSPTNAHDVADDMLGRVDMIIDGGECDFGLESTIVKIEDNGTMTLLRPGRITPDELSGIAPVRIADAVTDKLREGEIVLSPGMKYRHYAPSAELLLLDGAPADVVRYVNSEGVGNSAIICYDEDVDYYRRELADSHVYPFGEREDMQAQAHSLFSLLREIDRGEYARIYAPLPEKRGIGLALYNRMIRAAAHTIIKLK